MLTKMPCSLSLVAGLIAALTGTGARFLTVVTGGGASENSQGAMAALIGMNAKSFKIVLTKTAAGFGGVFFSSLGWKVLRIGH
ncbi:hypothetical protein [Sinimarinibacterium sp. NLF-5-8]|uniref:hypothetical protein n=1 Tax=Sinimarinibacterium sp. NLF-5-8 TaxID=2698684 RepID=UPI00137C1A8C|nr:hypothetical protein [Sinimarinibacterium sp. NLF-5-8]QHS09110.1 hypothetical protein GT972_02380 [Sinimarinibacterium sp. NLF-5-8]